MLSFQDLPVADEPAEPRGEEVGGALAPVDVEGTEGDDVEAPEATDDATPEDEAPAMAGSEPAAAATPRLINDRDALPEAYFSQF